MADDAHSRRYARSELDREVAETAKARGTRTKHGPVFIVGMPRSGTKLLRGLLNQSSDVHILDIETDFFPFLVRWVRQHGEPLDAASFARLYGVMRNAPYFAHRNERVPFSWQQWRIWCDRFDAAGLFEGFVRYETDSPRERDLLWGDKSPGYIRHIDLLLENFPEARIVHIVRDVRDYCASIRKAWNKDVRRAAFLWARDVGAAHRRCQDDPRYLEVRYEDLLQVPELQMRRICEFLSIKFVDAMVRLKAPAENLGDATGSLEIVRDNFAKFTNKLTAREIRDIESLAFDTMSLLGFEPLHATRPRAMRPLELQLRRLGDGVRLASRGNGKFGIAERLRFHLAHGRFAH
jgi:hypothetical protein